MSPAKLSWIESIQAFFVQSIAVLIGPLYDAGHLRSLVVVGSTLVVFSTLMISFGTQYRQIQLSQAFCVGLGTSCHYIPCVAILLQYFSTKHSLVTGIAASGSSLGGLIYPIVFRQLKPRVGFAWTTRGLSLIALVTLLIPISALRDRRVLRQRRSMVDSSALRDAPYLIFSAAMYFVDTGFSVQSSASNHTQSKFRRLIQVLPSISSL